MDIGTYSDAAAVALAGARLIADEARAADEARGQFLLAVSGGTTPWEMLKALVDEEVPWSAVHIFQVDERVAPLDHADRNLKHLEKSLGRIRPEPPQIHAMPVEAADLDAAAKQYAAELAQFAGSPAVLDVVHLGLGADGHTASLVPHDPVLDIADRDVAATGEYQGRRRMTLTYPLINRARKILWLVTSAAKGRMLERLRAADRAIPAGRVRQDNAVILADRAAANG